MNQSQVNADRSQPIHADWPSGQDQAPRLSWIPELADDGAVDRTAVGDLDEPAALNLVESALQYSSNCSRLAACSSTVGSDRGGVGRKIAAAPSSDLQAWVTERSQASSPGTVRLLAQTAPSRQMLASKSSAARSPVATNQPSKITAKGSSRSTQATAAGAGQPLARIPPHLRPAPRSIASHRCRAPPGHARTGDTLALPRLIHVFSGVYSWFHLQCVFGVFWESRKGSKW